MNNKKDNNQFPSSWKLMVYVLRSIKNLGGKATIEEMKNKIVEEYSLHGDIFEKKLRPTGNQTELDLRLAWARSHLKLIGLIHPLSRGVWSLAALNLDLEKYDEKKMEKLLTEKREAANPSSLDGERKKEKEKESEKIPVNKKIKPLSNLPETSVFRTSGALRLGRNLSKLSDDELMAGFADFRAEIKARMKKQ